MRGVQTATGEGDAALGGSGPRPTWPSSRRGPERLLALAALFLIAAVFAWAFHPQHFFFDSYHYMVLSYGLTVGDAHPFGFGLVLRAVRGLSERFGGAFAYFFQVWQVSCFATLGWIGWNGLRASPRFRKLSLGRRVGIALLCFIVATLVLPALVYLMNGYWSEMTSFMAVALATLCLDRAWHSGKTRYWVAFCAVCLFGWHVRYQLATLAPALAVTALVLCGVRRVWPLRYLRTALVVMAATLGVLWLGQRMLATWLPKSDFGRYVTGAFVQRSIQCQLRCAAKLYEVDCSSERGRALIETVTCTELNMDLVSLGPPVIDPLQWPRTFAHVGTAGVLEWLVRAPLSYLQEDVFSGLEHEHYGRKIRSLSVHRAELEPYARLLPQAGAKPSPAFDKVVTYLLARYREDLAFHWLTLFSLIVCAYVVACSRNPSAVFLAVTCFATYLVMAYFQPKAPMRYLVQISVPGLLAGWLALWEGNPDPSLPSE
jgi:hypothetical protein